MTSRRVFLSALALFALPFCLAAGPEWQRSDAFLRPGGKLIIFDGYHYRYLSDSNYPNPNYQRTHQNIDGVDVSVMEKIAQTLPMTQCPRPEYDRDILTALGFTHLETIVMSRAGNEIQDFALMCEKHHAD